MPHFQTLFTLSLFFICLYMFIKKHSHFISILLSLEFIALSTYLIAIFFTYYFFNDLFYSFYYLSVVVCESALGLALIVVYARSKGNELLNPGSM